MVARAGIEPPTRGFSGLDEGNLSPLRKPNSLICLISKPPRVGLELSPVGSGLLTLRRRPGVLNRQLRLIDLRARCRPRQLLRRRLVDLTLASDTIEVLPRHR